MSKAILEFTSDKILGLIEKFHNRKIAFTKDKMGIHVGGAVGVAGGADAEAAGDAEAED